MLRMTNPWNNLNPLNNLYHQDHQNAIALNTSGREPNGWLSSEQMSLGKTIKQSKPSETSKKYSLPAIHVGFTNDKYFVAELSSLEMYCGFERFEVFDGSEEFKTRCTPQKTSLLL